MGSNVTRMAYLHMQKNAPDWASSNHLKRKKEITFYFWGGFLFDSAESHRVSHLDAMQWKTKILML
jgi:hypothetical protein